MVEGWGLSLMLLWEGTRAGVLMNVQVSSEAMFLRVPRELPA